MAEALPAAAVTGGEPGAILELGLVVAALALAARLAGAAGLSPIPLYLLAGLAFGTGGLVPVGFSEEFISVGADIGVILLLFMLGLEYTGEELGGAVRASLPAGALDLVLNFAPGAAAALLLGWGGLEALVLGGITAISSSGIVAKLLGDLGWLGNRETPAVLSILVIEDLAMALYLPVLAVLLAGDDVTSGAAALAVAIVAVALALLLATRYGRHMSRPLARRSDEVLLLSTLGLVLLVGGGAEQLQISAAVGAFLVGIALSGEVADRARVLLGPLRDLFAAIFFVFFGLQTDPGAIPGVAAAAVALGLVSVGTKLGTGWIAARRIGVAVRGRARAGSSLVARGEFSILIAGLGAAAGLEEELAPLAAAYVLLMAVTGPLLTRASEPLADAALARAVR